MTLAKFSVWDIHVKLCKHENKTNLPIYSIKITRGRNNKNTYIHNSISYTREQAFKIYRDIVLNLTYRYLHLQCNKHILTFYI